MWTFSYDLYPKRKTENKVASFMNLVNNCYYMFIHDINGSST